MHDVIILGDGLTALAAAAALASTGCRPLLVDGGTRYEAESCFPLYYQDAERGVLGLLLDRLNVTAEWQPVSIADRVFFPQLDLSRPRSWAVFRNDCLRAFPEAATALSTYFDTVEGLGREWLGLLDGRLRFTTAEIPYSVRHAHLSYESFISQTFQGQPNLAAFLCAGLPVHDVALTVMAGYLYTQVFDSCVLQGGLPAVRCILEAALVQHGGERVLTVDLSTLLEEGGRVVGVQLANGAQFRGSMVLDTRGDSGSPAAPGPRLSWFSLSLELDGTVPGLPETEVWYDYPDLDVAGTLRSLEAAKGLPEKFPLVIWNPDGWEGRTGERQRLRIDVPLRAQGSEDTYQKFCAWVLERVEMRIPSLAGRVLSCDVRTPEWHGLNSGFWDGTGTRWAFSVSRVMRNPLRLERRPHYFDTTPWGFAWFSAAAVAVQQIAATWEAIKLIKERGQSDAG